jgi:hypothetical protein
MTDRKNSFWGTVRVWRSAGFGLVAGLALGWAFSAESQAVLPDDLAEGARVEVDGTLSESGEVVAVEIEIKRTPAGTDDLEARVDAVDAAERTLKIAGVAVVLESDAEVTDDDGAPLQLENVRPGQQAEVEGRFEDGVFRASAMEVEDLDADEATQVEIEGTISELDSARSTIRVLGLVVRVTPHTEVELD